ncbi:MAG: hypothetical protein RDU59_00775 [Thermodesulfobacteriota bacterium]|nr:hypothetical protein [Thermodesulfobacteriota bacterium]
MEAYLFIMSGRTRSMININRNHIITRGFSNQFTAHLYNELCRKPGWIEKQCGGCSYYGKFNEDWGLCCNSKARFHLETVFEHFGCEKTVEEGWNAHSFDDKPGPNPDDLIRLLQRCRDFLEKERGFSKSHRALVLEIDHLFRSHQLAGG